MSELKAFDITKHKHYTWFYCNRNEVGTHGTYKVIDRDVYDDTTINGPFLAQSVRKMLSPSWYFRDYCRNTIKLRSAVAYEPYNKLIVHHKNQVDYAIGYYGEETNVIIYDRYIWIRLGRIGIYMDKSRIYCYYDKELVFTVKKVDDNIDTSITSSTVSYHEIKNLSKICTSITLGKNSLFKYDTPFIQKFIAKTTKTHNVAICFNEKIQQLMKDVNIMYSNFLTKRQEVVDKMKVVEVKKVEIPTTLSCVICMDKERTYMFNDCKHICVCDTCNSMIKACPLCMKQSASIRVYL